MNKKIILSAILAAYLGAIGSAYAQDRHEGRDGRDGRDNGGQRDDRDNRGNNDNRGDNRGNDNRGNGHDNGNHYGDRNDHGERRNDRYDYHQADNRGPDRGAGPRHDLRRGGRLPPEYRGRQYVVDDWRGHRLSAPPRGYQWVQTGSDYVLAAVATGVILNLLINN